MRIRIIQLQFITISNFFFHLKFFKMFINFLTELMSIIDLNKHSRTNQKKAYKKYETIVLKKTIKRNYEIYVYMIANIHFLLYFI